MDMDQAAVFFAGSILTALGFLVWIVVILLVNNLVATYWKSWGWSWINWSHHHEPTRFMTEEEAKELAHGQETSKKV